MQAEKEQKFCAVLSESAGEPLFATATTTRFYFLLEYPGAWQSKAFENSDLPQEVKDHLDAGLAQVPASKLLLIRQPGQRPAGRLRFIVALLTGANQGIYRWDLESFSDLLALNLTEIAAGRALPGAILETEQLFLVCTNGRRDACCARLGLPVYSWLSENGSSVWECSHVGGHRFAANVLVLPDGVMYGRVNHANVANIWESARSARIYLPNLRGRLIYTAPAQAAEFFLRQRTNEDALMAFDLLSVDETSPRAWIVRFKSKENGRFYRLNLAQDDHAGDVYESCALDKVARIVTYRQISLEESKNDE
jgi:hypothetical protein